MNKMFLRFINFPGLLVLTLMGIGIQTSLFSFWPLNYLQPDIVLFIVVWAALRRNFWEGGWITLFVADFAELHSAAPQGMFMITYMLVFLLVRGLSRLVVIPNLYSLIMVTLFVSVFWKLSSLGVLHLLGASSNQWRHTLLYLFPGAVVEGMLGLWAYRGLERYDWFTFKSARRSGESEQGSADIEGMEEELRLYEG